MVDISREMRVEITAEDKTKRAVASAKGGLAGLTSSLGLVGVAIGGLGLGMLAKDLASAADSMTLMNAKLNLVSGSFEDVAAIAKETRQGLEPTVELYTRMARATEEMGLSQDRLLKITESLSKANIVSGASQAEAGAALLQLSQGMASGVLRGQELNSVMEQTPRIARMIAEGMGVTIGQLRQLGMAGEITTEKLINALEKAGATVDAEFAQMPQTIAQAFTGLSNSTTIAIGELNEMAGAANMVTTAINGIATAMDGVPSAARRMEKGFDSANLGLLRGLQDLAQAAEKSGFFGEFSAKNFDVMVDVYQKRMLEASRAAGEIEKEFSIDEMVDGLDAFYSADFEIGKKPESVVAAPEVDGKKLSALINRFKTEDQLLREKYDTERDLLIAATDEELTIVGGKGAALLKLDVQYREDKADIRRVAWEEENAEAIANAEERKALEDQLREASAVTSALYRESLLTEEDVENNRYQRQLAQLDSLRLEKVDHNKIEADLYYTHEQRLTEINRAESEKRREQSKREKLAVVQNISQAANLVGMIANTSALLADKNSRSDFERQKKFNTASAVVNTAAAAVKAYNTVGGGWWGVPVMLFTIAQGMAQVAAINSQTFDGGGSLSGSVSGGAPSVPDIPFPEPAEVTVAPPDLSRQGVVYNIEVHGNVVSQDEFARELIEPLEQARLDGVESEL